MNKSEVLAIVQNNIQGLEAKREFIEDAKMYVLAPNGLSLRKENKLNSEKLIIMPLGSEVVLLEAAMGESLEVEHIKGGMHFVSYEGQTGYAFSGFLGGFPLRGKDQGTDMYISQLKEEFPNITYETKSNDPDFHEGATDTFTLPATSWHEAYYVVSAMYELPKTLGFPNPSGSALETFEDPSKLDSTWSSYLTATRENNILQKIEYAYRVEAFGFNVEITRKSEQLFLVEYLVFVD